MFVRPAPGLQLRRPDTLTLVPAGGEDVPDLDWCNRRLRDGDALERPADAPGLDAPGPDAAEPATHDAEHGA